MSNSIVFEVAEAKTSRYRRQRWILMVLCMAGAVVSMGLAGLVLVDPQGVAGENPTVVLAATVLAGLALGGVGAFYFRPSALAINRVAITDSGLYPPFKPKGHRTAADWFVPYADVVSMDAFEGAAEMAAFRITLANGESFEIQAADVLQYVDLAEARRFAGALGIASKRALDEKAT